MKIKLVMIISLMFLMVLLVGCQSTKDTEVRKQDMKVKAKDTEIKILGTGDLHSILTDSMVSYVNEEREKNKNLLMVDAGDFYGTQSREMWEWSSGKKLINIRRDGRAEYDDIIKSSKDEVPIVKDMAKLKYDAVVLGDNEFVSNDKQSLDKLVSDFKNNNMPLVSANIYEQSGENYVQPYVMKNIKTDDGDVKVGILGLTIKEVGETLGLEDFEKDKKARELGEQADYKGKLYANDLVEDAKKWIKVMEKESPDIIVAVVHSGEEPKTDRNPGNRIKELANTVDGIDAIIAGHTHKKIDEHKYKNKSGDEVIVTQPGSHGDRMSEINFKLNKENGKWDIKEKSSKLKIIDKEISIVATADLHSHFSDKLTVDLVNERSNPIEPVVVDAGDFLDPQTDEMTQWYKEWKNIRDNNSDKTISRCPMVKDMNQGMYDAVVLGNHEFVSEKDEFWSDERLLDAVIEDFEQVAISVLSANIYRQSGKNYVKPYIIKDVETNEGNVKVGILGLTIKEVGKGLENVNLQEQFQYKDKLYANDLVEDAKKWVKVMKKEKPDIIVAVVHSGEEPKNPKHPGNRIKELATTVDGIDAIVASHTHEKIDEHEYKNKSGEKVIVTQPGEHGKYYSKITFKVNKEKGSWIINDKFSKTIEVE
ncbi:TPA: metallophosphoesterase [Clostridioides difficile]|uniref:metallophosphoesterase n=1 Tax=Clostridioides difficile TaxID=1496 RepID=UPI00038DA076|nr:metallophosphoesterase [Clostridioides difficile]AXU26683.1 nucleotide phosphodiesterase [Clostridioides difficile]AXU30542.1 nucleotide phosphodiesterase [Clostridioides difficile]AXU34330.1 nucleotide phosphodiesterase [Clostridioides difficile]EQE88211.1 calcineurin-like phosphoesterase family protein [Clostridioides difficile CD69]KJF64154.1 nucleotide phosphodiesterase [Clostridioides difficile]